MIKVKILSATTVEKWVQDIQLTHNEVIMMKRMSHNQKTIPNQTCLQVVT